MTLKGFGYNDEFIKFFTKALKFEKEVFDALDTNSKYFLINFISSVKKDKDKLNVQDINNLKKLVNDLTIVLVLYYTLMSDTKMLSI